MILYFRRNIWSFEAFFLNCPEKNNQNDIFSEISVIVAGVYGLIPLATFRWHYLHLKLIYLHSAMFRDRAHTTHPEKGEGESQ